MGIKKILIAAFSAGVIMSLASMTAMADSNGWKEDDNGWRYYTSSSNYVKDAWKSVDGNWYYFMDDGYALTDCWAYIEHKLYHFDSNGHMEKNKWIECGKHNSKYDLYSPNMDLMKTDKYKNAKDYRYVGSDGAAYVGWKKIGGSWYYFSDNKNWYMGCQFGRYGLMQLGWFYDKDESHYCFDPDGKLLTNTWFNPTGDVWFYFDSSGRSNEGWQKINGQWYYFTPYSGVEGYTHTMVIGYEWTYVLNGRFGYMLFDKNGRPLTGWQQYEGKWYYADSEGYLYSDKWLKYKGSYYYFDRDCRMVTDANDYFIDGRLYSFNSSGICTNNSGEKVDGWHEIKGKDKPSNITSKLYVYVGSDGVTYTEKWLNYKGAWYYFDSQGYMFTDNYLVENGKVYEFGEDGKCKDPNPSHKGWYNAAFKYGDETFDNWFYYGSDGRVLTGWQKINNKWYHFSEYSGLMECGGIFGFSDESEDMWHFKEDGELVIGWYKSKDGNWYYSDSSGRVFEDGWLNYGGKWYYFYGHITLNNFEYFMINDRYYDFDENGACLNPEGRPIGVMIVEKFDN